MKRGNDFQTNKDKYVSIYKQTDLPSVTRLDIAYFLII